MIVCHWLSSHEERVLWINRFGTNPFTPTPAPKRDPFVLHAEIWPSVMEEKVQDILRAAPDTIRDQVQIRAMCQWIYELDQNDVLGSFFNTPARLDAQDIKHCVKDKGWILG